MKSASYWIGKADKLQVIGHYASADMCRDMARKIRNSRRRQQNEMLRELCGTSAAAARRDMGL